MYYVGLISWFEKWSTVNFPIEKWLPLEFEIANGLKYVLSESVLVSSTLPVLFVRFLGNVSKVSSVSYWSWHCFQISFKMKGYYLIGKMTGGPFSRSGMRPVALKR